VSADSLRPPACAFAAQTNFTSFMGSPLIRSPVGRLADAQWQMYRGCRRQSRRPVGLGGSSRDSCAATRVVRPYRRDAGDLCMFRE
jgi:hypothetical protein